MTELEQTPFRSYWHTASVAGMPVFVGALILMLSGVQPDGSVLLWNTLTLVAIVVIVVMVGSLAIRVQTRKENTHCTTRIGRRYMLFVFVSSFVGISSVVQLVAGVLAGWIRLNIHVLLLGMMAAVATALIGAGILWRTIGQAHAGHRSK